VVLSILFYDLPDNFRVLAGEVIPRPIRLICVGVGYCHDPIAASENFGPGATILGMD
jgi:hypothetical protein